MNGLSRSMDISEYSATSGLYVCADLHPEYGMRLRPLAQELGCPELDLDDLHCTLVYSREKLPERLPDIPGYMKGMVTGVQSWVGHNDKVYVVADISSTPMIDAHARLLRTGAEHSFVGFKPHVTLGSFQPDQVPENLEERLKTVMAKLQRDPITVIFHRVRARDIDADH